jgi:hypothetical protein
VIHVTIPFCPSPLSISHYTDVFSCYLVCVTVGSFVFVLSFCRSLFLLG